MYFPSNIDLMATAVNTQINEFISWKTKRNACASDSFSVAWAQFKLYVFPPFSIVGNFLTTQPTITCSKLTVETLEQGVKYVQS